MKSFFKTVVISLQSILLISFAMLVYGYVTRGEFNIGNIYNANFFIGALIIAVGLVVLFMPARIGKLDKLSDHTTFVERHVEHREQKQEKAHGFILLGILIIVFTGLIQLVVRALFSIE